MYKIIKNIGLILLVIASFIYTEKATLVVKEYDQLMIELKDKTNDYEVEKKEAIIRDNTIIPGISKKTVDIDKSYGKMREYSKFDPNLIIYKYQYPKDKLSDNKDKFIIKTQKDSVALIIKVNNTTNIDELINSGEDVTLYMDSSYIKNNKEKVIKLKNLNYTILTNNKALKKITKEKEGYCMSEDYDIDILANCYKNNDYTIKPNIIVKDRNYYKLDSLIDKGSIILTNQNNLKNVLKFIKNKGLKIESIKDLLDENN